MFTPAKNWNKQNVKNDRFASGRIDVSIVLSCSSFLLVVFFCWVLSTRLMWVYRLLQVRNWVLVRNQFCCKCFKCRLPSIFLNKIKPTDGWSPLDISQSNMSDTNGNSVSSPFKYIHHKVQLYSFISFIIQSFFIKILSVFLCHSTCQACSNSWVKGLKGGWRSRILIKASEISKNCFSLW